MNPVEQRQNSPLSLAKLVLVSVRPLVGRPEAETGPLPLSGVEHFACPFPPATNIVAGQSDMSAIPSSSPRPTSVWLRLLRTVCVLAFFAFLFTWLLRVSDRSMQEHGRSAGFTLGVLHGICMPAAMPHLLLGVDIPIYATENTGRTYKLGYTVGVNSAGLVFFGSFYWRFQRMRRALADRPTN